MDKLTKAQNILKTNLPDLQAIYHFGSTAKQQGTAYSDIDLAFLSKQKIDDVTRFETQEKIALAINQDVDLIDLKQASTVMRYQIIMHSKTLYIADSDYVKSFENLIMSMYLRFNEERKPILDAIKKRGSIL